MNIQPLYYTIIKPKGERYNNDIKLGGKDFVVNTAIDIEDHHYVNRVGVVVSTPDFETPWKVGDEVLLHHNVFRSFWDAQGELAASSNLVEDDYFVAEEQQIFAKRVNGEWETFNNWVLVTPDFDNELHGVVLAGKLKGSKVLFSPKSEYRFDVDDEVFYKMRERDITAKIL